MQKAHKKVWIPTAIYSISIPLILVAMGEISLNTKQIIYLFFPVLSNQYWFSTVFIAVTLLLPFLGKLLKVLDRNYLMKLMIILLLIDCIQPMLGCNAFSNIGYGLLHATATPPVKARLKNVILRELAAPPHPT